jgi:hypothetical protein
MFYKALIALLLIPSFAFAQIKIDGPKEGTVGYMVKLKVAQLDGNDPKIRCIPENPDWIATKDFDGTAYIIFVPGKRLLNKNEKSKLFTFVLSVNKDNKTFLETHEITVYPDEDIPAPIPPEDEILKSELYKTLFAAYKVSPAAESKARLIGIYEVFLEEVKADKFASFREANAILAKTAANTGLQSVKDKVAEYLVSTVGQTGWNKTLLTNSMTRIIACLKKIPD